MGHKVAAGLRAARPRGATDPVGELPAGEHVVGAERIASADAPGLADTIIGHDHGPLRHGSMIARAPRASRLTAPARRTKSDSVVESYETLTHQIGPLLAVLLVAFVCGAALARLMLADAGGQADPTRVAGQVITGVGFIGGGAILQAGGTIMGLTSAAVIWTAAGIGLFVGAGYPLLAMVITATVVTMLVALRIAEERVLRRFRR